jgi:hypothetical protein
MRYIVPAVLLVASVCPGQTPTIPNEQQYLRFILLNIASLDHHPDAIRSFENQLVKQFGLSAQDSAQIHAAGVALRPLLDQNRRSGQASAAGKNTLSQADLAALQNLDTQREQKIAGLADQVLSSVSPTIAARLRSAGNKVAGGINKKN